MFRVDLSRLILALCLVSVVLTLGTGVFASYLVQRDLLLASSLKHNQVYARKLASLTDNYLRNLNRDMAYLAHRLGVERHSQSEIDSVVEHMHKQSRDFNSLVVFDATGQVIAQSPSNLGLVGTRPRTERTLRALEKREPVLSEPFKAVTGRWLVTQLTPIFDETGGYAGYLIGNLYLHQDNSLQSLLGEHHFEDGSHSYVVDREGRLLYHPQVDRIGQQTQDNEVVTRLKRGEHGELRTVTAAGDPALAGYAAVPSSGWGIVVQRPEATALQRLDELTLSTLRTAAPLLIVSLVLVAWLASLLARPLQAMARLARDMDDPGTTAALRTLRCWYREAAQLRRALLSGMWAMQHKISGLRQESATDPLSGLLNRRGLQAAIDRLAAQGTPTAVIVVDVDRFKVVNDTLGHDAGDEIIRKIAQRMRDLSRQYDITARAGGEEFVILLPETTTADALEQAEVLRRDIREVGHSWPLPVTVSCGVAQIPGHSDSIDEAWRLADKALYYAKRCGRDRTCMVDHMAADGFATA